ncbi:hypothetical protein SMF913_14566 [Streptomyces malaysiensis]|uniref:Uncharacterized protein n=1 Tax=Streptomyces malaysiensis TaxID=92644 RepID=A0A2J7ZE41_STRMQ|nr:hypothetical protein SMF913_14566 [Streptomyces malaysiensis]
MRTQRLHTLSGWGFGQPTAVSPPRVCFELLREGVASPSTTATPAQPLRGYVPGAAARPRVVVAEEPAFAMDARKKLVMIIRNPVWPVWFA